MSHPVSCGSPFTLDRCNCVISFNSNYIFLYSLNIRYFSNNQVVYLMKRISILKDMQKEMHGGPFFHTWSNEQITVKENLSGRKKKNFSSTEKVLLATILSKSKMEIPRETPHSKSLWFHFSRDFLSTYSQFFFTIYWDFPANYELNELRCKIWELFRLLA